MEGELGSIVSVAFFAACITGSAAWCLALGEFDGVRVFRERTFRHGPVILRDRLVLPAPRAAALRLDESFQTESGEFKRVRPDTCLLRERPRHGGLRGYTAAPSLKGCASFQDDGCDVHVRVSLFMTLFTGSWLLAWVLGGLLVAFAGGSAALPLGLFSCGLAVFGAALVRNRRLEIQRARRLVAELEQRLRQ